MDRFDDMRAKSSKPKLQAKSATPTVNSQTVSADTGYDGLSQVIVSGDTDLLPSNIKSGVNIFGVEGTLESAKLQSKSVTPKASKQIVTADDGYNGLSQVTVTGDNNLVAGNIKNGVSIFGVSGSYSGGSSGSGSTGYNVFVQQSEPTSKAGVWIKSSGGSGAKFYEYATAEGEFLEASKFNFLKTTEETVAQQIIDGYMYVIARYSSSSYRINLETQAKTSINTLAFEDPSKNYLIPIGSFVYNGKIYVVGGYSYKCYCYIYDPIENSSSSLIGLGTYTADTSTQSQNRGCYEYDGKVIMVYGRYNYPYYKIYDIENEKLLVDQAELFSQNYGTSTISGYGQYIYFMSSAAGGYNQLYKFDMNERTKTYITTLDNMCLPFATGEYIYLFRTSTGGSGFNEYYRYNIATGEKETIKTSEKYYLYATPYYLSSTINSLMLDDKTGILYFRTSKGTMQPSGMQFTPSPELDELSTGTAVIVQSQYKNVVKMQNSSNIHSGVENAYVKTSDGLKSELTFLGDGEKWNLLKNPNGETATVKFNSNGGTSVDSVEVVIGQKLLTKPETTRSDNYIFDAWYLGSEPFNFNTQIIKDITLTAHWLEYEEVDYIESSGTQYIDTGVKGSAKNRIELDLQYVGNTSNYQMNGLYDENGMRNDIGLSDSNVFWGVSTNSVTSETVADNERHTYFIDCTDGSYGIDGVTIGSVTPATVEDTTLNVLLGARKNVTKVDGYCYEKIFSGKYYIDGTLVRNFQPIKIETGTYALIDKVNNKAYFNAGTGSFTGGNIQTPKELEYIESTGTQYIDTGYIPNKTTILKAQVEFTTTSQQTYAVVAGTQNTENGTNAFLMFCNNLLDARTGDSGNIVTNINIETEKTFELELKFNEYKINGTSYNGELEWTIDITGTLYLMARHCPAKSDGLYPNSMAKIKINKFQIYDNDTLIRDFIPYKDEYGIVCLYDKVNDKKYYNQGTGEFIAGEEV